MSHPAQILTIHALRGLGTAMLWGLVEFLALARWRWAARWRGER